MKKVCAACGEEKLISLFPLQSGRPRSKCKPCESEWQRQYRNENRERLLAQKREYYLANREAHAEASAIRRVEKAEEIAAKKREYYQRTREATIARSHARYASKRDEILERQQAYYEGNKERIKARVRAYTAAHPEVLAKMHAARGDAERRAVAQWDAELTDFVAAEAASLCRLRSKLVGGVWHIDHQIPLQRKTVSGLHVWNNLAVVPARFNQQKKNKFGEKWMGRAWL